MLLVKRTFQKCIARAVAPPPAGAFAIIPNMLHCCSDIVSIIDFEAFIVTSKRCKMQDRSITVVYDLRPVYSDTTQLDVELSWVVSL